MKLGLVCLAVLLLGEPVRVPAAVPDGQDFSLIERGRYLAVLADCTACHGDPQQHSAFGGGRAIETPFGTLLAANITPDRDTGIGAWSEAQFDAAVRRGRMPDGRRLYPGMPFAYYAKLSAADVHALRAYLLTVPAVRHSVRTNRLPFPLSLRFGMVFWDWLYFDAAPWRAMPQRSADWNRGSFLVEGPGHCGACHTPKTFLGGDEQRRALRGYSLQGWFAPDLTGDSARGLAGWSVADIVEYLRSGHNRFAAASGPMGEEVSDSSAHVMQADLIAIATYLKTLPGPHRGPAAPLAPDDPLMQAGAAIYEDQCSACHQLDGTGVPRLIPDLAHSASIASREPTTLLRVVLHGAQSVATDAEPTAPQMPSYAWQLSDAQVAAVCTYLRNSWGHAARAVTASEARAARLRGS